MEKLVGGEKCANSIQNLTTFWGTGQDPPVLIDTGSACDDEESETNGNHYFTSKHAQQMETLA